MLSARKSLRCNKLKLFTYFQEFICLVLISVFSCLWVISLEENKANSKELRPLLALEKLIPQHEVQLLNANFSDQMHYDQLAQVQSEFEALVVEANVSQSAQQLLKEYTETSLNYTQLTSMLKTSQRLISGDSEFEETQLTQAIDNIRLKMFSFVSNPNLADKAALTELLFSIDFKNKQQTNWEHLQLVKLHSLFVLDNYELTANYRQKLIDTQLIEAIIQERTELEQQIQQTTVKRYVGMLGALLAIFFLLFVIVKRNLNALKKTANMHEEFASNVLERLDSKEGSDKPVPVLRRKQV